MEQCKTAHLGDIFWQADVLHWEVRIKQRHQNWPKDPKEQINHVGQSIIIQDMDPCRLFITFPLRSPCLVVAPSLNCQYFVPPYLCLVLIESGDRRPKPSISSPFVDQKLFFWALDLQVQAAKIAPSCDNWRQSLWPPPERAGKMWQAHFLRKWPHHATAKKTVRAVKSPFWSNHNSCELECESYLIMKSTPWFLKHIQRPDADLSSNMFKSSVSTSHKIWSKDVKSLCYSTVHCSDHCLRVGSKSAPAKGTLYKQIWWNLDRRKLHRAIRCCWQPDERRVEHKHKNSRVETRTYGLSTCNYRYRTWIYLNCFNMSKKNCLCLYEPFIIFMSSLFLLKPPTSISTTCATQLPQLLEITPFPLAPVAHAPAVDTQVREGAWDQREIPDPASGKSQQEDYKWLNII